MQTLLAIKSLIADYEKKYHRNHGSVHLLAVSKGQATEKIQTAYQAGQRAFGENYLQEALDKMSALADKEIEWHFIGKIQKNKTRKIAEHFAWVQSISDIQIAQRLNEQRPSHLPPLNVCIEVNISHEETKLGITPEQVWTLAQDCMNLKQLRLRGLMVIPAPTDDVIQQRKTFHDVFALYQNLCQRGLALDTLSMGMSDDMEAAIAEGSTMVRIGRRLFGQRS